MAKKLRDLLSWQVDVTSDVEWEEALAKEGLIIIDIYNGWAGPCVVMQGYLKTLRNKLGDAPVVFATARADDIECLERFRGRCEPQFSLYKGNVLMSRIRGVDQPKLFCAIYRHLEKDSSPDYEDIKSPPPQMEEEEIAAEEARRAKQLRAKKVAELKPLLEQGYTIGIILPDVVATENIDSIVEIITLKGFNVVDRKETTLTDKAVRDLYQDSEHEEYFDDLISFMTSAPIIVLLITKDEDVVAEWNGLLGPEDAKVAKQVDPECLRALYGTDKLRNGIHGSFDEECAVREAAILFPDIFREEYELEEEDKSKQGEKIELVAEGEQKAEAEDAGTEVKLTEAESEDEKGEEIQQAAEGEVVMEEAEPAMKSAMEEAMTTEEGEIKEAVAFKQAVKEMEGRLPTTESEQKQESTEKTKIDGEAMDQTEGTESKMETEEKVGKQDIEQAAVETMPAIETEDREMAQTSDENAAVDKANESEIRGTESDTDQVNGTMQSDNVEYVISQRDINLEDMPTDDLNMAVTELEKVDISKNKASVESAGEQSEEDNSPGSMVEVPGLSSDGADEA